MLNKYDSIPGKFGEVNGDGPHLQEICDLYQRVGVVIIKVGD